VSLGNKDLRSVQGKYPKMAFRNNTRYVLEENQGCKNLNVDTRHRT